MAHRPASSAISVGDLARDAHPISLKVLRLSRPNLTLHNPLPTPGNELSSTISSVASVAYPSALQLDSSGFALTPLLTLPPAFGNAYVGSEFTCTLCANNELSPSIPEPNTDIVVTLSSEEDARQRYFLDLQKANAHHTESRDVEKKLTNVRMEAEMKTPTQVFPLDLALGSSASDEVKLGSVIALSPGHTLQGIITHQLREEGHHVLAVTVSYNETGATSGRLRSFRRLYQFVAKPALDVRTKISEYARKGSKGSDTNRRWALEAQLENLCDETIVLTGVTFDCKPWYDAKSLNWEAKLNGNSLKRNPVLASGDIQQICFLIDEKAFDVKMADDGNAVEVLDVIQRRDKEGRLVLGRLNIEWRGPMGSRGSLGTAWLAAG